MDKDTNILEAGLGWITKLDKGDFIGRDALLKSKEDGLKRKIVCFIIEDKLVARHGQEVYSGTQKIGYVTSGGPSPVLEKNIGLAYINNGYNELGKEIEILVRNKKVNAKIVKTPFLN
jgi:aminomethyltransferase